MTLQTRQLPGTDLTVGRVAFGTMTFGAQVGPDEAAEMVQTCRGAGVTMFDTANNYNDGASEEILGRIVKPFRDEVVLCTKAGNPVLEDGERLRGLSRRALLRAAEASLRRLGVEHIDVYYLHCPDWETPLDETLEALDELVRSGKVRHVGQSNHTAWQVAEMLTIARFRHLPAARVSQPQYNLLSRRVEAEYESCSRRFGLGNIVYNPLAGGLLTGKHRLDERVAAGSRFTKATYQDRYWNSRQFEAVDRLRLVAQEAGLSLVELAFRWLLARPLTDCILVGASSKRQLEENLAAAGAGGDLDADTIAACDAVWSDIGGVAPPYSR